MDSNDLNIRLVIFEALGIASVKLKLSIEKIKMSRKWVIL